MPTYDYNESQFGDKLDHSGVFSPGERDAILHAIEDAGVFSSSSTAGKLINVESLPFGEVPGTGHEATYFEGAPTGPVNIEPGDDHNVIFASDDDLSISIHGDHSSIVATGDGNDVVISDGLSNDSILVGEGDNSVDAGSGNDYVLAGDGNDTINGGAGNDSIHAGGGDDSIFGGSGQ